MKSCSDSFTSGTCDYTRSSEPCACVVPPPESPCETCVEETCPDDRASLYCEGGWDYTDCLLDCGGARIDCTIACRNVQVMCESGCAGAAMCLTGCRTAHGACTDTCDADKMACDDGCRGMFPEGSVAYDAVEACSDGPCAGACTASP